MFKEFIGGIGRLVGIGGRTPQAQTPDDLFASPSQVSVGRENFGNILGTAAVGIGAAAIGGGFNGLGAGGFPGQGQRVNNSRGGRGRRNNNNISARVRARGVLSPGGIISNSPRGNGGRRANNNGQTPQFNQAGFQNGGILAGLTGVAGAVPGVGNFANNLQNNAVQGIASSFVGGGNPLQGFGGANPFSAVGGAGAQGLGLAGGVQQGGLGAGGIGAGIGAAGFGTAAGLTALNGAGIIPQGAGGRGGFIPLVIAPLISLVTTLRSLFKIKRAIGTAGAVDTSNVQTGYDSYLSYSDEIEGKNYFDGPPDNEFEDRTLGDQIDYNVTGELRYF